MPLLRAEFDDLVRMHHAAVFRTAARLLPTADAEDVTQNVFTELWLGRARVGDQADASLRWLAGRFALNALRSRRRRVHHEALAAPRDPCAATTDAETRAAVHGALGMLPADLRAAVVLRYQEDLTFDGIAVALRCSESTAHDRVRRGLDKLRHLLTRAGFAAVAARLPTALPTLAATPVPPTLVARLDAVPELCLAPAGAAVASTSLAMPLATLAVIALAAGAWWFARERAQVAMAHAAAAHAAAALPPALALSRPPSEPAERRQLIDGAQRSKVADTAMARAVGVVFDEIDGRHIAGAAVRVEPIEVTKASIALARTHTDADGRFEVAWPCTDIGCRCLITALGYEGFLHRDDHCAPGAPLDLRVALVRIKAQPWRARVLVQDSEGLPVAYALAMVFGYSGGELVHENSADGQHPAKPEWSTGGASADAQGIAKVTGTHLGEKLLVVKAETAGYAAVAQRFVVDHAATPELTVTLPRGRTVTGIVRDVATRQPVGYLNLLASQLVGGFGEFATSSARSDQQGRFELNGCSPGALSISSPGTQIDGGWSPFAGASFAADVTHVELWVKRCDDVTAAGLHLGEVHGHCVDAATGAPLLGYPEVETVRIPDGIQDWRTHVLEEVLNPLPVQTFTDTEDERDAPPPPPPTDAVHVVGLTEGQHALVVRMPDHAPALVGPFRGGLGQLQRDVPIRIGAGGTLTITVSDARGTPLGNANVWLTADADAVTAARAQVDALAKRERPRYLRTTAANEPTVYDRVPAGVTLRAIAATARGFAVSAPFVLRDGGQHEIQLRLDQ
jgi:RNA polymerase sigma-70 factor (ECF subfamily)